MKKFIVRIGYTDYTVESEDAVVLLAIAARMLHVKQVGYSGPYYVQPDQEPWLDQLQMQEVQYIATDGEPGKFTKATREIPF
jgi:hypothetical protein